MEKEKLKSYSKKFKQQMLKECIETNNYHAVARKNNIPPTTLYSWVKKDKNKSKINNSKAQSSLEKELTDLKLENLILKELLKKTHQLWLSD